MMVRMRWATHARVLWAIALAAALLAAIGPFAPRRAEAHAVLVSSNPENGAREQRPPFRIVLNFSEPVEPRLTDISVTNQDGEEVDNGDVEIDPSDGRTASVGVPTLSPGLYTVTFSNVSTVDGHPWNGVFQFIILNPDGTVPEGAEFDPDAAGASGTGALPENIDAALKWVAMLALATTAGAAFFVVTVMRPAAAFLDPAEHDEAAAAGERWVVNISHVLLPVSFIAGSLLLLISVNRFETPIGLWEYVTDVQVGRYRGIQLALLALALAGADLLFLASAPRLKRGGLLVLLVAGAGALLMFSLVSHSAVGEGRYWATLSDYLHLLAATAWLGALAMLVPFMFWSRRHVSDDAKRYLYMANVFDRFSVVATLSVVTIITTGTFNGLAAMPDAEAMLDTTYGRVLLAKLVLLAPLLAVAGINAFVLKPRLVRLIDGLYQGDASVDPSRRSAWERSLVTLQRWLPRTVVLEVALLVAVFASVSVLTQTSTAEGERAQEAARAEASNVFTDTREADGLTLTLAIQPNTVGLNRYDLDILDATGAPADDVITQARLRFYYQDPAAAGGANQGFAELILREDADGGFTGQGSYFTQPGSWRVEVGIRRAGADDISRSFVVAVAPPESASQPSDDPWALPFTVFTWNEVVGALLAIIGGLVLLYRQQLGWARQLGYRVAVTVATALILAGAVLGFGVDTHSSVANPGEGNPIKPTDASIAAGAALFQQNCIVCHGPEGRGDGPQAAQLDPRPVDIRQHLPLHTDRQFFAFIERGVPGTAMPAWGDQLSEEDIWNLINYMRSRFTDAAQ